MKVCLYGLHKWEYDDEYSRRCLRCDRREKLDWEQFIHRWMPLDEEDEERPPVRVLIEFTPVILAACAYFVYVLVSEYQSGELVVSRGIAAAAGIVFAIGYVVLTFRLYLKKRNAANDAGHT